MNKSFSKKRHIQEVNQRLEERVLSEQSFGYGASGGMSLNQGAQVAKVYSDYYKQNPHVVNNVMQLGALLIPVVGPFISAGIGLVDAAAYAKEGKTTEAGLTAIFSLIPGMASVVTKIPGVKQLGQKGMTALATKVLRKAPLNAVEQGVLTGLQANSALVQQQANLTVKAMAANAAQKIADTTVKKSVQHIAKHGVEKGTEHAIAHAVAPHGAQPNAATSVAKPRV